MNAMQMLSSQPWVERLGWTLVHFLWQGLAIAASVCRRAPSMARVEPECAIPARLRGAGGHDGRSARDLGADAAIGRKSGRRLSHPQYPPPLPAAVATVAHRPRCPMRVRATVSSVQPAQFLPWVVIVWLAGAAVFWMRLAGGWVVAARMRSMLVRRAPPEWQETLRKARRADRSVSSRAVAGLRAGAGADGGRLAAAGGAGAGGGARRSACRACGGAAAA